MFIDFFISRSWSYSLCLLCLVSGLFNMLSDSSHEIRQQADSALSEFLLEIKNSPVSFLFLMIISFYLIWWFDSENIWRCDPILCLERTSFFVNTLFYFPFIFLYFWLWCCCFKVGRLWSNGWNFGSKGVCCWCIYSSDCHHLGMHFREWSQCFLALILI